MKKVSLFLAMAVLLLSGIALYVYSKEVSEQSCPFKEAMQLANDGKCDEAITLIKQTIKEKRDAESKGAHLNLGLVYYKAKQYDNALDEFVKTVEMNKKSPMAYYFMGLIYEAKAVEENDLKTKKDLQNSALKAWENYLSYSNGKRPESHRNIGITVEESHKRAKQHIATLKEELHHEKN